MLLFVTKYNFLSNVGSIDFLQLNLEILIMNKTHIDDSLERIREIFQRASIRIESLRVGQKIPATVLAEEIAKDYGKTGPQIYPILRYLLDNYPGVKITKGAKGGIQKLDSNKSTEHQVDFSNHEKVVPEFENDEGLDKILPIINT